MKVFDRDQNVNKSKNSGFLPNIHEQSKTRHHS